MQYAFVQVLAGALSGNDAPQDGNEPAAKRARLQAGGGADPEPEADGAEEAAGAGDTGAAQLLADIARHERELRDRNTSLSVLGKRFSKAIEIGLRCGMCAEAGGGCFKGIPYGTPPSSKGAERHSHQGV